MKKGGATRTEVPAMLIDTMFRDLPDWQRTMMSRLRTLIQQTCPDVIEEIKWRKPSNPDGVPVWSHEGILCLGNVWRDHVRLTFSKGALLKDSKHVFNAALNGNSLRALDLHEGDSFDEEALKALVRGAVALNESNAARRGRDLGGHSRGSRSDRIGRTQGSLVDGAIRRS